MLSLTKKQTSELFDCRKWKGELMLEHFLSGVALAGSSLISFFVGLVIGGLWAAAIYVAYIRKQKRK